MKLKQKKALITGASKGIGRAIALAFAQQGADVLISYRSDEKNARQTVAEIKKMGRYSDLIQADFTTVKSTLSFYKKALKSLGHIDILVNNAAQYDTSDFLNLDIESFERLLQVNVRAPLQLIQESAKDMIQKNIKGAFINISSISGVRPCYNRSAHSTAKAALNQLTQNCALELGPYGIRVNAIAPGSTPHNENIDGYVTKGIPLQRTGTPTDQANAAVFLASDEAEWITGQILVVDGGHSLSFCAQDDMKA